ncbi:MAG: formate dehydrogenase accessory sulfurtransferase FdhD [Candidatus Hodarchaeota archaeon]
MSVPVGLEKINFKTRTRTRVDEPVASEAPVNIFVNDSYVITLLATPEYKKELALGWLFDEGVLQSLAEIRQIIVSEDRITVHTLSPITDKRLKVSGVSRIITTAGGLSVEKFLKIIEENLWQPVTSDYSIEAEVLMRMTYKLDESHLYRRTGGGHVAALFEDGRFIALAEDIGRHNTIDKVIGMSLQAHVNFSRSVLVCSGRQPADMVLKAARMQIPIVVSQAAPIQSGVIAADRTGVTLVCFVRDRQMNVYTHPHRVVTTDFRRESVESEYVKP